MSDYGFIKLHPDVVMLTLRYADKDGELQEFSKVYEDLPDNSSEKFKQIMGYYFRDAFKALENSRK